jgi:hypothetical protein
VSSQPSVDLQLASVIERAAALATQAPAAMPQHAESDLGALYQQAEAEQNTAASTAIATAWSHVQAIAASAANANELAAGLIAVAREIKDQRDAALKQHDDLSQALETWDIGHPKIREAYGAVEMSFMDDIMYNGGYLFDYDPGEEIEEAFYRIAGIEDEEVPNLRLCSLLFQSIVNIESLTLDEAREYFAFIRDFFARVETRLLAESAERAAQNQEKWAAVRSQNNSDALLDIIDDDEDGEDEE